MPWRRWPEGSCGRGGRRSLSTPRRAQSCLGTSLSNGLGRSCARELRRTSGPRLAHPVVGVAFPLWLSAAPTITPRTLPTIDAMRVDAAEERPDRLLASQHVPGDVRSVLRDAPALPLRLLAVLPPDPQTSKNSR